MAVHIPIRPTNRAVPARCDPGMDACLPELAARACIDSIIDSNHRNIEGGKTDQNVAMAAAKLVPRDDLGQSPRAVAYGSFLRRVVHADQSEAQHGRPSRAVGGAVA